MSDDQRRREAIDLYARTMHNRGLSTEADYLALTDDMIIGGGVDAFDSRDLGVNWLDVRARLSELSRES